MFIPTGLNYNARIKGDIAKRVVCEVCAAPYEYTFKASVLGRGSSFLFLDNAGAASRAEERARSKLQNLVMNGSAPAPCPKCLHVQKHMSWRIWKRQTWVWFAFAFLPCLSGSFLLLFPNENIPRPTAFFAGACHLSVGLALIATGLAIHALQAWLRVPALRKWAMKRYRVRPVSTEERVEAV
jgi:hypothetical protein